MKCGGTVIYDGDCGICQTSRKWAGWLDWFRCFGWRALQEEAIYREFRFLRKQDCFEEMHLITPTGKVYRGADAAIRIALFLPLTFWLGALFHLPPLRALAHPIYRRIARNRHSCKV